MKSCDDKFKSSLMEAVRLDDSGLEEELQNSEPHVFSESFENRMEELFEAHKRKSKRISFLRYATAAAAVVILLVGSMVFIGSKQLRASVSRFDITQWSDGFFALEGGEGFIRDGEIPFDETRLGYIPEGFEKVYEEKGFAFVSYKYENSVGEYFKISVQGNQAEFLIDNESVEIEVKMNAAGYEYLYVVRDSEHFRMVIWIDNEEMCYRLRGNISYEEIIKIMDSISH